MCFGFPLVLHIVSALYMSAGWQNISTSHCNVYSRLHCRLCLLSGRVTI